MNKWGKAAVGGIVTVVALWWVLRGEDLPAIWGAILDADPLLLFVSIFIATFGFFIRALRWDVLLAPVAPHTRLGSRFASISIGFMATNVLPARAGEFARPYALSRMEPVTMSAAFGTLVVERFLDGVMLLLLLVVPLMLPGFPATDALGSGWGALILNGAIAGVVVVLAALVFMAAMPDRFVRVAEWCARFLPRPLARRVVDSLASFLGAMSIMRDPKLMAMAFAWTAFFWLWHGMSFWVGMLAFGIDTGLASAFFTEAVVGFAVALPAAPGLLGTFQAGSGFALETVYGVDSVAATAFSFGYWGAGWVPITAIGLYYAWKIGLSLGDMGAAEERVEEAVESEHPDAKDVLDRE